MSNLTTDWLNGKSLYFVQYDDFGYDVMKWNMARMDFTDSSLNWTEYDTATGTFSYNIDSNGDIVVNEEHIGLISVNGTTNDYIKVCKDGDCNTYLFFDEGKARDFRDNKN